MNTILQQRDKFPDAYICDIFKQKLKEINLWSSSSKIKIINHPTIYKHGIPSFTIEIQNSDFIILCFLSSDENKIRYFLDIYPVHNDQHTLGITNNKPVSTTIFIPAVVGIHHSNNIVIPHDVEINTIFNYVFEKIQNILDTYKIYEIIKGIIVETYQ